MAIFELLVCILTLWQELTPKKGQGFFIGRIIKCSRFTAKKIWIFFYVATIEFARNLLKNSYIFSMQSLTVS